MRRGAAPRGARRQMMRWRGIATAPVLVLCIYVLLLCARFVDTAALSTGNGYLTIAVLQLLIFLLPAAIYSKLRGGKFRTHLRLRLFGGEQLLLILAAGSALIFGSLLLGFTWGGMEGLGGRFSLYDTFVSPGQEVSGNLIYSLLAFAALPALCEEFVFRSILCAEYEANGLPAAIIISSLFFAMLHFNLAQFPIYFFAGILLSLVLYASRSVLGPILVHFLYNLFGLFGQGYITEFYSRTGSTELFIFLVILFFLLSMLLFFGEAARTYSGYARRGVPSPHHRVRSAKERSALPFVEALLTPASLLCALFYLVIIAA